MTKQKLHIVKIGGNIINNSDKLHKVLDVFGQLKDPKILVHGGGKTASDMEAALGLKTRKVDGRRITDEKSLKVVVMTYAGYVNKTIVAHLQSIKCNSLGLCGADMNIIESKKRKHQSIDYGFVGDIVSVNVTVFNALFNMKVTPVISAITHDNNAQLLNTNADSIAAEIAMAMSNEYEVSLKYCFEYQGVLRDINNPTDTIKMIDVEILQDYKDKALIHSGMLPKLDNAIAAKANGVSEVSICGIDNLINQNNATQIK